MLSRRMAAPGALAEQAASDERDNVPAAALLMVSGTGLFVVYNDRRDVLDTTSYDTVGRSFVIKFTRLFDM